MDDSVQTWEVTHFRLEIQRLIYLEKDLDAARALIARMAGESQPTQEEEHGES